MLLAYILFWILLIWGLRESDIYWQEGAILVTLWVVCLAGFVYLPSANIAFIIGSVLLDLWLLMKTLGQDIRGV